MKLKLYKSILNGEVIAPPSKSYAHRFIMASCLAKKESKIENLNFSDDILATLHCVKALGGNYVKEQNRIKMLAKNKKKEIIPLFHCLDSGSTLRFFIPLALINYEESIFVCSDQLLNRGVSLYQEIFKDQNITIERRKKCFRVKGNLKPGVFEVRGDISSQYLTGLLFALPLLDGESVIKIIPPIYSKSYLDMTLDVLKQYKIDFEYKDNEIKIKGKQVYKARNHKVEGDYSNASFLAAFNYFDSNIVINGLNLNSLQGDKAYQEYFEILNKQNAVIDIANCIDLGPVLFAFAALKHGATFINVDRLKNKESNRIYAMKEELNKVGIKLEVSSNQVIVHHSKLKKPIEEFNSHGDHRIAMALSLISTQFDIVINQAEVINKSYPNYFNELKRLGARIDEMG